MKLLIALSALVAACWAQSEQARSTASELENRTPFCEQADQPATDLPPLAGGQGGLPPLARDRGLAALGLVGRGGRKRRQTTENFNPDDHPFVWFTVDQELTDYRDCRDLSKTGNYKLNKGPIIVPLGKLRVCVKFDKASRWFYTKGTNGPCDPDNKCCGWYPPSRCSKRTLVPIWFELPAGSSSCEDAYNSGAGQPRLGVDYLQNRIVGDRSKICILLNPEREEGEPAQFDTVSTKVAFCGEGCCIFDRE